nr:hypothetical protein [Candidatus Enterovibrio luxaltus]
MHGIITAELSASNVIDGVRQSNLFKHTCRSINEISYDSACDIR